MKVQLFTAEFFLFFLFKSQQTETVCSRKSIPLFEKSTLLFTLAWDTSDLSKSGSYLVLVLELVEFTETKTLAIKFLV